MQLFRLLISIVIVLVVARLLRSLLQSGRRYYGTIRPSGGRSGLDDQHRAQQDDTLTPYEIEDADYEEIHPDSG